MRTFNVLINRGARTGVLPREIQDQTLEQIETFAGTHDPIPMSIYDNGYSFDSSDPTDFPRLRTAIEKGWHTSKTIHLFTRAWAKPSSNYSGS